jgi:hypothetical protein
MVPTMQRTSSTVPILHFACKNDYWYVTAFNLISAFAIKVRFGDLYRSGSGGQTSTHVIFTEVLAAMT